MHCGVIARFRVRSECVEDRPSIGFVSVGGMASRRAPQQVRVPRRRPRQSEGSDWQLNFYPPNTERRVKANTLYAPQESGTPGRWTTSDKTDTSISFFDIASSCQPVHGRI
jgi:hypothetical protein